MQKKLNAKPRSCKTCFMGCGKYVNITEGKHKGLKLEGPEYETIYAFGGLCMVDNIKDIAWLNDICDRLGMDTISAGNLAALTIEASQRGKIDEGIKSASEEMDMKDMAVHVKGLEPAGYDPRVLKGMGLAYAVSPRGACHLKSTFYKPELSGMIDPDQIENKAELFLDFEDRCTLFDTFILCRFYRDFYPWEELSKIFFMTTGIEFSKKDLQALASRVTDETRKFNLREGLTIEDDFLPPRLFKKKLENQKGISKDELTQLIQDYYKLRG